MNGIDSAAINGLRGMTIAITGSSTGIGRSIALQMAAAGAKLIVHGRLMSKELEEVHQEIIAAGGTATAIECDLSEPKLIKGFIDRCWAVHGTIDCWINNAGADILTGTPVNWSFTEKLELLWQVDARGTLIVSRLVGKKMRETAGDAVGKYSIINMGWDQAWQGMEGESGELFGTVKGAVMAASKSLAHSLAPQVRVNCLAPGWIKTEWGETTSDAWQKRAKKQSLMNRWGTADDVAAAAVWLANPSSSFMSGQIISVNGGFRHW